MRELSYRPSLVCDDGQLCPPWPALLLKYPDHFLLSSDTWVVLRWPHHEAPMQAYLVWLGGLPREVAEQVAWRNAERLFL